MPEAVTAPSLRELVERRVALKRQGTLWWGLCPFHDERSPSFAVYPDDHYHCHGCGAHGGTILWLMRIEKMSAKEAEEALGKKWRPVPRKANPEPVEASWDPEPGVAWQEVAFLRERLVQSWWRDAAAMRQAFRVPQMTDDELRQAYPHAQPWVLERLRQMYPVRNDVMEGYL